MRIWLLIASLLAMPGAPAAGDESDVTPQLTIEVLPGRVTVAGVASSVAHESILQNTASRLFTDHVANIRVDVQVVTIPGWALVSDVTFQALAETRSSSATIGSNGVSIRGFLRDADRWAAAVKRIERALPPGWTLDQQVETIAAVAPINRQCIELFRTATRGRKIAFARASATLSTAAGPLLDELIQIATDCPASLIDITGHTDKTGEESVNLALSQARADAVAGYFRTGGISADRLNATGVGSTEPLTPEASVQARRLNRRIEIALRFP